MLSVLCHQALALRDLSIREIARCTGLSRNTIRRYLRGDAVEPQYPKRGSKSKLDPYAQKLVGWLKSETSKSRRGTRLCRIKSALNDRSW
jgi:transcriptional regulator with XRE-family HTH domain